MFSSFIMIIKSLHIVDSKRSLKVLGAVIIVAIHLGIYTSIAIFFFKLWTGIASEVYKPVRLYFTGEIRSAVVVSMKKYREDGILRSRIIRELTLSGVPFPIEVVRRDFNQITRGETVTCLINPGIKAAIIADSRNVSLIYVLRRYPSFGIGKTVLLIFYIVSLGAPGLIFTYVGLWQRVVSIKSKHPDKEKWLLRLIICKEMLPYLMLLVSAYLFAIIASKAVYSVENSNETVTGFVLIFSIVLICYLIPVVSLLKQWFEQSKVVEYIKTSIEIGIYGFSIYKLLAFLAENDLTKFQDIKEVAIAFITFFIGIN